MNKGLTFHDVHPPRMSGFSLASSQAEAERQRQRQRNKPSGHRVALTANNNQELEQDEDDDAQEEEEEEEETRARVRETCIGSSLSSVFVLVLGNQCTYVLALWCTFRCTRWV